MQTSDILVAGAGPVGLAMACELRRHGVGCRIIDPFPEPANQCKAIGVQPPTLEIWENMGIVVDAGLWLHGMRAYVNGKQTAEMVLDLPDVPYGFLALPQYETDRILTAQLNRVGTMIERKTAVTSFEQHGDEVVVMITRPDPDRKKFDAAISSAATARTARCVVDWGCHSMGIVTPNNTSSAMWKYIGIWRTAGPIGSFMWPAAKWTIFWSASRFRARADTGCRCSRHRFDCGTAARRA
jgi:hypothetical protein